MFDQAVVMLGEFRLWSLLRLKGASTSLTETRVDESVCKLFSHSVRELSLRVHDSLIRAVVTDLSSLTRLKRSARARKGDKTAV